MKKFLKISGKGLIATILVFNLAVSCEDNDDDDPYAGKADPNTIATLNLIAYFPFESEPAAGNAIDNSNNEITFVRKVGSGSFTPGIRGNAYQGSEQESYLEYSVDAGSALRTLDEVTLACWIKTPVTTEGTAKIFSLDGGDPIMGNLALLQESQPLGDSVDMKIFLYDSASPEWKGQDMRENNAEFLNDEWFHLIALYRKGTSEMEFYANGQRVLSQIKYAGPVPPTGSQPLLEAITLGDEMSTIHFGAWTQQVAGTHSPWMTYFKGQVDEFRIYNKALTATEAMSLYEAEVTQINP